MSTKNLKTPVFVKESSEVETKDGIVYEIPERRVSHVDDRILDVEKTAAVLGLNKQDEFRLKVVNDPVLWAQTYLVNPEKNTEPLSLRFYQKDILRTPSRFKILRLGRQCLHGDSLILMADETYKPIRDIVAGDKIFAYDQTLECLTEDEVIDQWSNGERLTYKITTESNKEIIATTNHPFYIKVGHKEYFDNHLVSYTDCEWATLQNGIKIGTELATVEDLDIVWEKVKAVEKYETVEVFHISVEHYRTFVANNYITHNTGKCITGNTLVSLPDGTSKYAEELYKDHKNTEFPIVSYNIDTNELEKDIGIIETDAKTDTIYIETRSGALGTFSFGHKMKVYDGETLIDKAAIDVELGDRIPIVTNEEKFQISRIEDTFEGLNALDMMIVGMMTFIGLKQYDTIIEYRRDNNYIATLIQEYVDNTPYAKVYVTTKAKLIAYRLVYTDGTNRIMRFLERYDLIPFDRSNNKLPSFIFRMPPSIIYGFLRGVYACRTFFRGKSASDYILTCETSYDDYSFKILQLLTKIGFKAYRKHKYGTKNSVKPDSIYVHIKDYHQILHFTNTIGQFMPDNEWTAMRTKLDELIEAAGAPIVYPEVMPDEIIKMEYYPAQQTYNVSVKNNHTLVCGGIITSNSVTMAVEMLWRAVNRSNFKIVLVCPFLSQVTTIFSRMKALTSGASPIKQMLARDRQNPPTLEFTNGSTIKGFVAGDSVAGQSANALYYDESDYISDGDKERINPIVFNFPDHIMIEASTPTGKREEFYRTCVDDNNYVEFHYPSHASPNWTEVTDSAYRASHSESAYEHEVLALFGDPDAGVFRGDNIDKAMEASKLYEDLNSNGKVIKRSYTYHEFLTTTADINDKRKPRFFMGVDWNAADNGTQIVIIGYLDKVYVANVVSIHASEFTQTKAVETIVSLDRDYQCEAIYVDLGFGGMQVETLHLYGKDHPESLLHKKVQGIDFSNKIEIPDIATGQVVKKRLKQFMIDRFQRLLENERFVIPTYENNENGLAEEMRNFEIARYGQYGEPIYGKKSPDHKIMACALAVFAFARIVENIGQYPYRPGLGKVANDLSRKIRMNTMTGGKYNRSKIENIVDNSLPSDRSSTKTISELAGISIPYRGIISSDGKFPKESSSRNLTSRKSLGSAYHSSHRGRRRF